MPLTPALWLSDFVVNAEFTGQEEEFPDLAALPGGGFITVYEDETPTTRSIRMTIRDADGLNPVTGSLGR